MMKQTGPHNYCGLGFLLAAGLALLLVISSGVAAQPGPTISSGAAADQTASNINTAITYQGTLDDGSSPTNGAYAFRFRLYDAASGGAQLGEVTVGNVAVTNGRFTVQLDFGANAYAAEAVWLEIAVDAGGYQTLAPRQPLTPAPLALNLPNVYTDPATGHVGIGTDTRFNSVTQLTVKSPNASGYGGMYVSTSGSGGRPFYGYSTDGSIASAWHEYNGVDDEWQLYMRGGTSAPDISVTAFGDTHIKGDVTQALGSDGMVKAAIYTPCGDGSIAAPRSFDNVNDSGILVSHGPTGHCFIDFGFDVSDRFWSATAVSVGDVGWGSTATCSLSGIGDTVLSCAYTNAGGSLLNGVIIVTIY